MMPIQRSNKRTILRYDKSIFKIEMFIQQSPSHGQNIGIIIKYDIRL